MTSLPRSQALDNWGPTHPSGTPSLAGLGPAPRNAPSHGEGAATSVRLRRIGQGTSMSASTWHTDGESRFLPTSLCALVPGSPPVSRRRRLLHPGFSLGTGTLPRGLPSFPGSPSYHGIVAQGVHEVRHLGALVHGEPDGTLVLVAGVEKQHVGLGAADLAHLGGEPCHAAHAAAGVDALARVLARLLQPAVHVVGVQYGELPAACRGPQQRAQREQPQR